MHGTCTLRRGRGRADKEEVARYTANPNVQRFQGDLSGVVFRRDGTALPRVVPHDPKTPLQRKSRGRIETVAEAWAGLTPEEHAGWARYADLAYAAGVRSESGKRLRPYDLFCGLGAKWLQVHGGTLPPRAAPVRPFLGDALTVIAEPFESGIRFRSNGPNGPLALTELLWQPLRNAARTPQADRYRTQAFVSFSPDALVADVEAKPGAYAVAVRWVLSTTGGASPLVPLGVVVVPKG